MSLSLKHLFPDSFSCLICTVMEMFVFICELMLKPDVQGFLWKPSSRRNWSVLLPPGGSCSCYKGVQPLLGRPGGASSSRPAAPPGAQHDHGLPGDPDHGPGSGQPQRLVRLCVEPNPRHSQGKRQSGDVQQIPARRRFDGPAVLRTSPSSGSAAPTPCR